MRSPRSLREAVVVPALAIGLAAGAVAMAGCSQPATGDTRLVVQVQSDAVTVENQTGTSLLRGEVSIIPAGIPKPYTALLLHMSMGEKRSIALDNFRMDGTPFRRDVANGRRVRVTAVDVGGKKYEREVPFQ